MGRRQLYYNSTYGLHCSSFLGPSATGDAVAGQMRVAAFLQPVDERYFEANGNAVAIYDYGLRLTRVA
ncbi:hypothetical protein AK812_SmicGene23140 [Symbiodinium microadriaticum]|uniref:Uncharacterized protein n=1 Tax=Symbiodinium microadriaticum TaxID=2951 RepID=A0A1Q9DHY8_SYMMI|nr:hypothetical protein AK812_SmicGene23140 [Symbiodinium microadriaticum]